MPRTVKCVKLGRELPGLDEPPFDTPLGQRIYENVSAEAWRQCGRKGRFAGAAEAADRDDAARSRLPQRDGEIEVAARFGAHSGLRRPLHCRCRDMRPDRRAQRQKERQRGKPVVLAGQIEVAVQHEIGKIRKPAVLEIHQEKSEIIENVDRSELVREFEAIEEGRPALEEADIAEMQVAVATPHFSSGGPPVEQGSDRGEPLQ